MIKQKGTIIKFQKKLAIIMTNDCKIVSIKRQPGMYVGLEILFNPNEIVHKKNKIVVTSQIIAGVAAIFIFLLAFFNPFSSNGVYAYVTVDSFTSIEFELDKNNKIIKVNYFNEDANALLKELDLKHQSVDVAIKEVIKKSNSEESVVLISACLKEESNAKSGDAKKKNSEEISKLIDICRSAAEDDTDKNIQPKVVETPYDYKKLADENKISLGRTVVYEKAKEQGIDMDIEEIKNKSIGEALKKVKIDDIAVAHDVKKAEPKKPAPEPKKNEPPKEKPDAIDTNNPNNIVDPKDKIPEPKNKPEGEIVAKPKDKPGETPVVEPKDKPTVKPETELKDKPEVKPESKPKDSPEVKPGPEPKDKPKEIPNSEPKLNNKP